MTSVTRRFGLASLLAAGALAGHELRYALAYGGHAGHESATQGHAYLSLVVPIALVAALFAAAHTLLRFAGPPRSREGGRRLLRLWLISALILAAAYCAQELLEGSLAAGHPAGVAGVLGHGGWIGLACAPFIGGLVALALRGAAVATEPHAPTARWRPRPTAAPLLASPRAVLQSTPDPLARFLAGRGPPARSV